MKNNKTSRHKPATARTSAELPMPIKVYNAEQGKDKPYDFINPNHYKKMSVETIDMMERIYGPAQTADYCELTAFKYRMRIGLKPTEPVDRDMEKIRWYEGRCEQLRRKANVK